MKNESMKRKDLPSLSRIELEQELAQLKDALFQRRMKAAMKQLKNVAEIRKIRSAIARILTFCAGSN